MIDYDLLFGDFGALVACCSVRSDLDRLLTTEESESMRNCATSVRNRAAAARLAARGLLDQCGYPDWSMPRKHGAAPEWPPGWTGSLSHSSQYAAAAVARRGNIAGIGIDIEPADPLPGEIRDAVIVRGEFGPFATVDFADRIVFCAKEASYKAVFPLDRRFLEFDGMSVNLDTGTAETSYGRRVSLSIHVDHRIVVLAKLAMADVGRSG